MPGSPLCGVFGSVSFTPDLLRNSVSPRLAPRQESFRCSQALPPHPCDAGSEWPPYPFQRRPMTKRLASSVASSSLWHNLIPSPPDGAGGAILAERTLRRAVDPHIATFLPVSYEPGYAYPLLVWLHNAGCNERHLPQVLKHVSIQNFVAVAPRGTARCGDGKVGYTWDQRPEGIASAEEAVDEAIRLAEDRFHIHPQRIFLIGHGAGGTMATRLALHRPRRFAGAATLSGALPTTHRPLRHWNQLRGLPFFLAASRDCQHYTQPEVCQDLRTLHSAGCNVSLRQYPGDDDLTTTMLADVNRWVMERVCGA